MRLFLLLTFFIPLPLLAQNSRVVADDFSQQDPAYMKKNAEAASTDDVGTVVDAEDQVTQLGALEGTNNGEDQGNQVNILGLVQGATFMRQCTRPDGSWACPLAAMSFADALAGAKAAQTSSSTGARFNPTAGYSTTSDTDYDAVVDEASTNLEALSEMGYGLNEDGSVTTPEGETMSARDYASASALQAKGMTAAQAQTAIDGLKQGQSESMKKLGMDENAVAATAAQPASTVGASSSGGAFSAAVAPQQEMVIEDVEYRSRKKKGKRLPASEAASLSKNFNGDPIGIKMADIFLIVHQSYKKKKEKKTEFINREY